MSAAYKRKSVTYYPKLRKQNRSNKVYVSPEKKAVVIAVVGAGGKTTYIETNARRLAAEGKKVAVTTTTHIYNPGVLYGIPGNGSEDETVPVCSTGGADYFGVPTDDGKLAPVRTENYKIICSRYDVVFVEADGSHGMPAKVPLEGEPVLPFNMDEAVVVMGKHAVGRTAAAVCQHYWKAEHKWVPGEVLLTEDHLRELASHYYIQPIRRSHPGVRTAFYLSDMYLSGHAEDVTDLTFVLMASGFGRRFSDRKNKLLEEFHGERLFQYALTHLIGAAKILKNCYHLNIHINVVTRYPEIMDWTAAIHEPFVKFFTNSTAEEGITSSIRIGTRSAMADCSQAVVFFTADMPYLGAQVISRYVWDFLASGKVYGCMAFRTEKVEPQAFDIRPGDFQGNVPLGYARPIRMKRTVQVTTTVPGAFRLNRPLIADRLLDLHGDHGAMKIIRKHPWETYYHYIERRYVEDIDYPGAQWKD